MGGVPVAVAIVVGLLSSFVQSIGLTIQRKSHIANDLLAAADQRRAVRRPLWLLGFGIYITSNIFSTIFQLDALPIVILAPLGAVSLIFNALTARILLGDRFGLGWLVGTALVAVGAVLIAVFGVVQEEEHGLDQILQLFKRGAFVGFFSVECVITVLVLIAAHVVSWHVRRQVGRIALSGESTPPISLPPSNYASPHSPAPIPFRRTYQSHVRRWSSPTSPQYAPNFPPKDDSKSPKRTRFSFLTKKPTLVQKVSDDHISQYDPVTDTDMDEKHQRTLSLCGLAFAACSGTLSGMCLVLAKAAVELLVITIDHFRTGKGVNEFARLQTWFLVGGLAICAILQLVYLNYSLAFASPALICPLAFCFFNLSSIFDGLVFYDQFGRLATYQIVLVSLGVAILLLGVWVVSAIQTGTGGVEVGTWVDEESICSELDVEEEAGEATTLLGGQVSSEPEPSEDDTSARAAAEGQNGGVMGLFGLPSPVDDPMSQSYPQPQQGGRNETLHRSVFSDSPIPGTFSSPRSPLSPTFRRRSHHHRGPRYGTLLPDLAHTGAPTGFSIGLGAASPGFVLRSTSLSIADNSLPGHGPSHNAHDHGHVHKYGRPGRSQSETPAGILGIMRNDHDPHPGGTREGTENVLEGTEHTAERAEADNLAEADLRNWEADDSHGRANRGWWDSIWSLGRRRIKLSD